MRKDRDYSDIPGTYVFDPEHSRQGYHLNMFCMSLTGDRSAATESAIVGDEFGSVRAAFNQSTQTRVNAV